MPQEVAHAVTLVRTERSGSGTLCSIYSREEMTTLRTLQDRFDAGSPV